MGLIIVASSFLLHSFIGSLHLNNNNNLIEYRTGVTFLHKLAIP